MQRKFILFHPLIRRLRALGNRLLPCQCLLCGKSLGEDRLCPDCELALPYLARLGPQCQSCALPLATDSGYCGQCLHRPPPFSHSLIPFRYDFPLDSLIHRFKYRRELTHGHALAQLMAAFLDNEYRERPELVMPDLIVPVPLHWARRLGRGFNQAEILGWDLARTLGLPQHSRLCRRRLHTPSQRGLSRPDRQSNLRGAFCLTSGAEAALAGRCVALLDDVVTTTSTSRALSRLLIDQGGAAEVQVWALARTPQPQRTGAPSR